MGWGCCYPKTVDGLVDGMSPQNPPFFLKSNINRIVFGMALKSNIKLCLNLAKMYIIHEMLIEPKGH